MPLKRGMVACAMLPDTLSSFPSPTPRTLTEMRDDSDWVSIAALGVIYSVIFYFGMLRLGFDKPVVVSLLFCAILLFIHLSNRLINKRAEIWTKEFFDYCREKRVNQDKLELSQNDVRDWMLVKYLNLHGAIATRTHRAFDIKILCNLDFWWKHNIVPLCDNPLVVEWRKKIDAKGDPQKEAEELYKKHFKWFMFWRGYYILRGDDQ
ncbi:MAG: hypothetical protein JSV08_01270 [Acidobacteriota bacterium]|nr:MAG: hypothetical protein JSV08_01270 [Acidobacteriota bacterium]